ncbi:MAG TPA: murein biosynthesis integral membrane protein MurJ [Tepidisphaeraceae bacterium]|jgi:putative peptidoglycan lipid II flippase|nr:murein biosynthesis integral membrane protein MurJ [Tepidisphaeraceae bacterium]
MSQQSQILSYPPAAEPARASSFLKHAKLIGLLTLASRIFGLGREIVAGHYMGTGLVASAFTVAFTIPNLFRKLFGEGALSAAFIPLYTQAVKQERDNNPQVDPASPRYLINANTFAAAAVNLLCVMLLAITIIGELILAAIAFHSPDMRPEGMLLTRLTAIMLPYVVLICGGAFLSGILQVHKRFGPPAAAPIILNVVHIIVLLIGARMLHLQANTPADQVVAIQTRLAYWLAAFVLVAGGMQVWLLTPGLKQVGFRFQPILHFWTPAIRKMLWLSLPVAMGAGVLQLSVLLDKGISMALMQGIDHAGRSITHFRFFGHWIRYPMAIGAPRRLDLAQFLYQFPLGIFAIALATAIFPHLSGESLEKDRTRFRAALRQGIEAALWEGLPASVGLMLIRMPAIRLLFQHGQVSAHDADLIGASLFYYASAIWAFSVLQIVNRAYYALHDTYTPFVMAVVNIALNLVVEIPLLWWLGEPAMAVGTMISFAVQTVIMVWMLDRKIGGLGLKQSVAPVLKMIAATAVMGLACAAVQHAPYFPHAHGRLSWAAQVALVMGVGAAVYLGVCWLLGVDMIGQLRPRRRAAAVAP